MKKALIVSFPRSGTHFLMNTLQLCFNYDNNGHGNLEPLGFNFHVPNNVHWVLTKMDASFPGIAFCIKSHHEHEFFSFALERILKDFTVFYVYRNMADVMESYRKHVAALPWVEGPTATTGAQFATMEPVGGMLRYQARQYATMADKYRAHVSGWINSEFRSDIVYVRYENLNERFDDEVLRIAEKIEIEPTVIQRPARDKGVVGDGKIAMYV